MTSTRTDAKKEILGFFGNDKHAAWDEVFRLSDTLKRHHSTDKLSVWAEQQRGEWVVVVYHGSAQRPRAATPS